MEVAPKNTLSRNNVLQWVLRKVRANKPATPIDIIPVNSGGSMLGEHSPRGELKKKMIVADREYETTAGKEDTQPLSELYKKPLTSYHTADTNTKDTPITNAPTVGERDTRPPSKAHTEPLTNNHTTSANANDAPRATTKQLHTNRARTYYIQHQVFNRCCNSQ